jgi:hypothetical protein
MGISHEASMDFSISCDCGRSLVVSEGLAGASATCECGGRVKVPSLKELRSNAGLAAVPIAPEDQIAGMLADGQLPGDKCLCCGQSTQSFLDYEAHCESQLSRGSDPDGWLFAFLFLTRLMPVMQHDANRFEVMGRDTIVPVKLGICESCQSRLPLGSGRMLGGVAIMLLIAALPAFWFDSRVALTMAGIAVVCQLLASHQRRASRAAVRDVASRISAYKELFRKFPHALILPPR